MWFDTYSAAKWRQVYDWPPDRRLFLLGDVPRKLPIENTRVHKTFIVVITICFGGKYVFGNILAMLIENKFLFSKKCFFWDNEQMKIENPSLFYSVTKANATLNPIQKCLGSWFTINFVLKMFFDSLNEKGLLV